MVQPIGLEDGPDKCVVGAQGVHPVCIMHIAASLHDRLGNLSLNVQ